MRRVGRIPRNINELRAPISNSSPIRGEAFASIIRTQTLGVAAGARERGAADRELPADYFSTYARRVRALGQNEAASAAPRFIRLSEAVWIVIGDLAQVENGVRELNLADQRHEAVQRSSPRTPRGIAASNASHNSCVNARMPLSRRRRCTHDSIDCRFHHSQISPKTGR